MKKKKFKDMKEIKKINKKKKISLQKTYNQNTFNKDKISEEINYISYCYQRYLIKFGIKTQKTVSTKE